MHSAFCVRNPRSRWNLCVVLGAALTLTLGCKGQLEPFSFKGSEAIADSSKHELDPLVKDAPLFQKQAHYKVFIGGVPLGTSIASKGSFPTKKQVIEIKILHRLGSSALLTEISLERAGTTPQTKWNEKFNTHQSEETLVSSLDQFPVSLGLNAEPGSADKFRKEMSGLFLEDSFAKDLEVAWFGKLPLQFILSDKEGLDEFSKSELKSPTELAWFSNAASLVEDSNRLLQDAQNCMVFARDAENQVIREFPQLPYLIHRKIYNFSNLCTRAAVLMSRPEAKKNLEQTLGDLHGLFRSLKEEDSRELPTELLGNTESLVMLDPVQKWAWVKTASSLLQSASRELSNVIALERSQKVDLSMKVSIDRLTPGSVVKGVLRAKDVRFKTEVKVAVDGKQAPNTWANFHDLLVQPVRLAALSTASAAEETPVGFKEIKGGGVVSGQAFAKGEANSLEILCESHNGQIGLDLGDAPRSLIQGPNGRGVWDKPFRLSLVNEFAKKAGASPSCRKVTFSIPKLLQQDIETEIKSFQRNILQSESEFQITNRNMRRMRVLPGTYELTLSSLVTGETLAVQNILIPEGNKKMAVHVRVPVSTR